ncbi:MAG: hypothetical protein D6714_10440 [Bacteroidetes bacterium]|nr:MAG: hypothetical protein D6714_10440 [Bacteroidota bacterium]
MVLKFEHAILALICWMTCLSPAVSQHLTEQDLILQPSELLTNNLTGDGNGVFINQLGNFNEVEVTQVQTETALLENLTRVLQSGNDNQAWIVQEGGGNELALIQYGEENLYKLLTQGTGNATVVVQNGIGNEIIQRLIQSHDNNIELVQEGNNNRIVQILDGVSGRNYAIRQVGDGLSVIIRQSSY